MPVEDAPNDEIRYLRRRSAPDDGSTTLKTIAPPDAAGGDRPVSRFLLMI